MGMFDNYNNINPDYIPNNTHNNTELKYMCIKNSLPRKIFDIKNNFIGYHWYTGERFEHTVSVNKSIQVENDAIIYTEEGQCPTITTVATHTGQHAYNTKDSKSWTFCGKDKNTYIWVEDNYLVYPLKGDKTITLCTDMNNKYIHFNIFNFRWESIYEKNGNIGESELSVSIDESLSEILVPGVYYVIISIGSDAVKRLFEKYMFIVG